MSEWEFGRELPLLVFKAVALTRAVLAAAHEQKAQTVPGRAEHYHCRSHGIGAKIRQRSRLFEPPLGIKLNDESFLENRFLFNREDSKCVITQIDEVLEVCFREAKLRG